ncbi:MAG: leucine-rich repeat protein [Prevotella sp.]|nr:leucine-rich repeat protein [Prevotella sp.]
MKTINTLLAALALCMSSVAQAQNNDLKPGDEVQLVNPEFDNGQTGWTKNNNNFGINTSEAFCDENKFASNWGGGVWGIEQTVEGLPNGVYLLQVNAFDMLTWSGRLADELKKQTTPSTYVFANDKQVRMKSVLDDALTGQNIYRYYKGESNYFEYLDDDDATCWMPVNNKAISVALYRSPLLYLNSVVAAVTDGKLTIGFKHDATSDTRVYWDHFRVTYLSNDVSKLQHLTDSVKNAALSNKALNDFLAQEEEEERQKMKLLDITVSVPGTLGDLMLAEVANLSDVKRLKVKGQLNEADLTNLRDRCLNLVEIDMSEAKNTEILERQFQEHKDLRYVKLPAYLTSLPDHAFYQCYSLNTVQLPSTLTSIGWEAFCRCYNLREAVLPEGITTMSDDCYNGAGLQKLVLPTTLKTIPRAAFRNNYELSDLQFNGQTTIFNSSLPFGYCTHLKRLVMPATMQSIGGYAFEGCERLEDVQLNEGLYELWGAFQGCKALKKLTLPSTMQALYGVPFSGCDSLKELTCLCVAPPFTMYNLTSGSDRSNPFGGRDQDKGRTVIVPYVSANVYKQTAGWDLHNIVASQQLPKDVFMNMPYTMTWPQELMTTWKPNIYIIPNAKNTSSESGNGGMLTYGSLYVGKNAGFSADTLNTYYSFYSAKEADRRWYFTPLFVDGTARADHIITEINVPKDFWTFFSVPYDVNVSEITSTHPDDPFAIRTYDGQKRAEGKNSEAWVNLTKDDVLHAGQGYIIRTTNSTSGQYYNNYFLPSVNNANKPKYFTNDHVAVTLANYPTEFAHNRSWNFLGNPYPCYFDIRAMQTTAPITIWNRRGSYETYSPQDDDYVLNPGQAFFIQRPLDNDEVVFLKEGRQMNTSIRDTIYYNSARAMTRVKPRRVFNVILTAEDHGETEMVDRTRFVINESATVGYDAGLDAPKFFSLEQGVAHLYTIVDRLQYAINERPAADGQILLGMQLPVGGTYTLALNSKTAETVTLVDNETGTETLLTDTGGYTFQANAGTNNNRFVLHLGSPTVVEPVAVELQQTEQLFDLQGRKVANGQMVNGQWSNSQLTKGIYIKQNKKVVVK